MSGEMCMPCSDTIRLFYLILTVTVRQGRTRPAIINYLHDNTDSRLPAHLAAQSEFPNAHAHTLRSVCEVPQSGNGTSMLLSGDDSLAALTTGLSTITSEMTSMSCDAQKVGKSRILVEGRLNVHSTCFFASRPLLRSTTGSSTASPIFVTLARRLNATVVSATPNSKVGAGCKAGGKEWNMLHIIIN